MQKKNRIIKDDMRRSILNVIYNRIQKGKSTLVIGEIGCGKTKLLEQIQPRKLTISNVESLGSLNYILASILRQHQYGTTPKKNRSVEYLQVICSIKNALIIIDNVNDLRPVVFRYVKRMMDVEIPVIMAGPPEVQEIMRERHEEIYCRLRVLRLQPVGIEDIRKDFPQFEPDTLEVIFGASFGNMWVFKEICDECLDKISELKQSKVNMEIVEKCI